MRSLISVFLLVPLVLQAQTGALPSDWQAVKSLLAGASVVATLRGGERVKGSFETATDEAVTIARSGVPRQIARADVVRLHQRVAASKARRIAIGAAVGGGIGLATGGVLYSKGDFEKTVISGMALIGAGAGALIGLVASMKRTSVLVYAAYPPA
ncbi:MAG TPA: hypothetical protein VHA11_07120 [Bryobacteraceae bacterium]|nr:hypothetical protein [Bryobacteraceae bacterium]